MTCFARYILIFISFALLGSAEERLSEYVTRCGSIANGYELDKSSGQCYKLNVLCGTWQFARQHCLREGAHLAVVETLHEAQVLLNLFFSTRPFRFFCEETSTAFIGFAMEQDRKWKSIFGHSLSASEYNWWAPGEPNNARGNEYCGAFGRDGMLYDEPCSAIRPFFCKKRASAHEPS